MSVRINRASRHAASGLANIDITSISSKPFYDLSTIVLYSLTRFASEALLIAARMLSSAYSC